MNKLLYICIFIFLVYFLFSKEAKQLNEPSWVLLKRAEVYKEKGDYAMAFTEARKSKSLFLEEKIDEYYGILRQSNKDKTDYEIKKIVEKRRDDMIKNDNYPSYHELIGDIYSATNFLSESVNEYKKAIEQKEFHEYKQKIIELNYKLANVYELQRNYDLADMVYREIGDSYLKTKDSGYWGRIKYYLKKDITLEQVWRIFKIDGMIYLKALFKIGKRSAMIQRKDEALFYLSNAAIVWQTYYNNIIKRDNFDFNYYNPVDFINYLSKKDYIEEIPKNDFFMDETLFFIGYVQLLNSEEKVADHYFKLAIIFSKGRPKENEIKYLINYFKMDRKHILTYNEITN